MSLKKKKGDKGKGKVKGKENGKRETEKSENIFCVDDVKTTATFTKKQIFNLLIALYNEIFKEREQKNLYLAEREKINIFWEIGRSKLEDYNSRIRNADVKIEEHLLKAQKTETIIRVKEKHLIGELTGELVTDIEDSSREAHNLRIGRAAEIALLKQDNEDLRSRIREFQLASQANLRMVRIKNSQELHDCIPIFEQSMTELIESRDYRLRTEIQQLQDKCSSTVAELEKLKNVKILSITDQQDKNVEDLRQFYNISNSKQMALIKDLNSKVHDLKRRKDWIEDKAQTLNSANDQKLFLLYDVSQEIEDLKQSIGKAKKENFKISIKRKKKEHTHKGEDLIKDKMDYDILNLKFATIVVQRDEIKTRLTNAILEVQQRAVLRECIARRCRFQKK